MGPVTPVGVTPVPTPRRGALARTGDGPTRLEVLAARIKGREKLTAILAYENGQDWYECREEAGRNFSIWCKPATGYTRQHGLRFINIYERFGPPHEHRQPVLRMVDASGAMLLAKPKYEPRIDEILTKLLKRYGPGASIGPLIITKTMVHEFLQPYEPEKKHPEYPNEETRLLVVEGEASKKDYNNFVRAAENLLDRWTTPELYERRESRSSSTSL
jgi:hypothetical protein